jgi:hypothetical protein
MKAKKFSEKFDVFRLKRFMLESELDVNASLHVKTGTMHDSSAFGRDLQNGDHVMLFDSLTSFRRKLLSLRRILLNLDKDQVKLRAKLLCSDAITSNFWRSFFARTQSCQTWLGTSLVGRDQVRLCMELPCTGAIKL